MILAIFCHWPQWNWPNAHELLGHGCSDGGSSVLITTYKILLASAAHADPLCQQQRPLSAMLIWMYFKETKWPLGSKSAISGPFCCGSVSSFSSQGISLSFIESWLSLLQNLSITIQWLAEYLIHRHELLHKILSDQDTISCCRGVRMDPWLGIHWLYHNHRI